MGEREAENPYQSPIAEVPERGRNFPVWRFMAAVFISVGLCGGMFSLHPVFGWLATVISVVALFRACVGIFQDLKRERVIRFQVASWLIASYVWMTILTFSTILVVYVVAMVLVLVTGFLPLRQAGAPMGLMDTLFIILILPAPLTGILFFGIGLRRIWPIFDEKRANVFRTDGDKKRHRPQ